MYESGQPIPQYSCLRILEEQGAWWPQPSSSKELDVRLMNNNKQSTYINR